MRSTASMTSFHVEFKLVNVFAHSPRMKLFMTFDIPQGRAIVSHQLNMWMNNSFRHHPLPKRHSTSWIGQTRVFFLLLTNLEMRSTENISFALYGVIWRRRIRTPMSFAFATMKDPVVDSRHNASGCEMIWKKAYKLLSSTWTVLYWLKRNGPLDSWS